ncbi:MAG: hypothetical protein ABI333_16350 [bacterium]
MRGNRVPFDYYQDLSAKQRKTYRESDEIVRVALPGLDRMLPVVARLREALVEGDRRTVQRVAAQLADLVTEDLEIGRVRVRVGRRRPTEADGSELHGRCSWDGEEQGELPLVEVWMRTAARGQVVAYRTFLRTLIHELCHHLDYELHGLDATFHTEGFFRRESSLVHQLAPRPLAKAAPEPGPEPEPEPEPGAKSEPESKSEPERTPRDQLSLPF